MSTLPTRHQIEQAGDLDFDTLRSAPKDVHIAIELAPDGLHIRAEYIGVLSSIPAAVERLRAAGLVELVEQNRRTAAAPAAKAKIERVEPLYKPDGTPCCPVHQRPLAEGRFGPYCSAKAKPGELANEKGYCALRFNS